MRFEIPTLTRCCGCLPLRRGIIILGYLSLAFAVFFLWVEVQFEQGWREHTVAVYRGATFYAEEWLPVLLYCIEIVFLLLLLVGAHMKKPGLLQVYYYYGVTTTGAALAIFVWALMSGNQPWEYKLDFFNYYYFLVELATIFIGVVTQAYLLLLIRSELQKPLESLHFVNHLAEVYVQLPALHNPNSFS